jgi:DNA-3-methyladenine glycosylase
VYVSYGIHHCVNVVTGSPGFANGVLLRAAWLPGEPERIAAGPALLANRFGLNKSHNALPVDSGAGLWLAPRPAALGEAFAGRDCPALIQTSRIGISQAQELPWRWYWQASRSVSRRVRGDRPPSCPPALPALNPPHSR